MIMFNYDKLEGRINEKFGDINTFAKHIRMGKDTINARIKGITEFKLSEIEKFMEALEIQPNEVQDHFFCLKS